jgi:hypothetical protein
VVGFKRMRHWLLGVAACVLATLVSAQVPSEMSLKDLDAYAQTAQHRWQASTHGEFLERLLPARLKPSQLPLADSPGAKLTSFYCVQCHQLVNPAMHDAQRWPKIVERMLPRMQGQGNMGSLMAQMMVAPTTNGVSGAPLKAPSAQELKQISDYLQAQGQAALKLSNASPALKRALVSPTGAQFQAACSQCHALPSPERFKAREWPGVVARMQSNMQFMNRVVGSKADPREPQLRMNDITQFLQAHAKP